MTTTATAQPSVPYRETEHGALFAEHQGPFAPEILPDTAEPLVFSREFTNGARVITVSAAAVIPDCYLPEMRDGDDLPTNVYDVSICVETRDAGDDGGDTADYEYDWANDVALTLDRAIEAAHNYIATIDPERDFA